MENIHQKDLKKLSLEQLNEMLMRQNKIMCKRLIDKGASVRRLRDAILQEINNRNQTETLTENLLNMNLACNCSAEFLKDKHVQYVCGKECNSLEKKFKPFSTLTHQKESLPLTATKSVRHISSAQGPLYSNESTKLVPLAESLALQVEQVNRVKEERTNKQLLQAQFVEGSVEFETKEVDPDEEMFEE